MFTRHFFPILFSAIVIALASCSPSEESAAQADASTVVIYGYDSLSSDLSDAISQHMQEKFDVTVDFQRIGDTGAVYTQLYLERENPVADVMIGLDQSYLPQLRDDNLLESYQPAALELAQDELLIARDYYALPFDFGYITLNADTTELDTLPQSWDALLDPALEKSIIMLNPATSSPGRNFLLYTIAVFGEPGYLDYWKALKPNILTVAGGWSEGYGLYNQGEAPMVVSYETSPAYHRQFEGTERYQALLFDSAAYLQVEIAGIVRNAKNRTNAERVIDYILSSEFQQLIPLNQFMYPVHPDAELPEAFVSDNTVEQPVWLDPAYVRENLPRWLEEWEDALR